MNQILTSFRKFDTQPNLFNCAKEFITDIILINVAKSVFTSLSLPGFAHYPVAVVSTAYLVYPFYLHVRRSDALWRPALKCALFSLTFFSSNGSIAERIYQSSLMTAFMECAVSVGLILNKNDSKKEDTNVELLRAKVEDLKEKLVAFDLAVMARKELYDMILDYDQKNPGVFGNRKHPPLSPTLSEQGKLETELSRVIYDIQSRLIFITTFPELKDEFEKQFKEVISERLITDQ